MDSKHFDALAKLLWTTRSRRSALGTVFGAMVLGQFPTPAATRKGRGKQRTQKRGKRKRSRRDGRAAGQRRSDARQKQAEAASTEAVPGKCCSSGNCAPGAGKNLGKCCYQGQNLAGKSFKGANLGQANFSGAILTNANFSSANLDKTCFVDANVTGAKFAGANTGTAIFCRTQTSQGVNNSGCNKGTICCPTCDEAHPCGADEVCCNGRCIPGECCANGEQGTCGPGEICCDRTCVAGGCCQAADCPTEVCRRRACTDHQCVSTPVFGQPGPQCPTVCCENAQGAPECCPEGATTCDAQGHCCTAPNRDETCGVDTPEPKCGVVTNTCGQQVDCGACPVRTCQVAICTGADNTCAYIPLFGEPGPNCGTICCEDGAGDPVCCAAGLTTCRPSGLCGAGCGDVCASGCTYDSVAAAVAAAAPGATIALCAGLFPANVAIDKDLALVGVGSGDDPATATILDGNNTGRVLEIADGVTVTVRNVRIQRGRAPGFTNGGGIFNAGTLTLKSVVVAGNTTASLGGGILNLGSLTLLDSDVTGNTAAADGGGIHTFGTLTLEAGSRVTSNLTGQRGGGIYVLDGMVMLEAGSIVAGNIAAVDGGGIFAGAGTVSVANTGIVTNNSISGNLLNNCRPEGAVPNCLG